MTNHACIYASIAVCSEMVLMGLLAIVLYLTRLVLLLERYIQQPDCVLLDRC